MSLPAPHELLRHRPPAVLVDAMARRADEGLVCTAAARAWTWPRMLEAAAQTAGLLAGLQDGGPAGAVIAQYRDVVLHVHAYDGPLRVVATLEHRVLHFWRCRVEVDDTTGRVLLAGMVALAADAPGAGSS